MLKKFLVINLCLITILQFSNLKTFAMKCFDVLENNEDINSIYNVELAKVKRVSDGDTIVINTGGQNIKARLLGIDCMETNKIHRAYRQAYENNLTIEEVLTQGKNATLELKNLIKMNNNLVYFKTMGIDYYGRLLVILYDKNFNNINDLMQQTGYCPAYVFAKSKR